VYEAVLEQKFKICTILPTVWCL